MRLVPERRRRLLAAALVGVVFAALAAFAPEAYAKKPRPTATPKRPPVGKDGMVAVPAGKFFMGCNEQVDFECMPDEKPGRYLELPAFRIDAKEVSVAQYRRCVDAKACTADGLTEAFHGGKEQPEYAQFCNWGKKGRDQHPINCITWSQAEAYCKWAGKRLPTEAEWERAARGTDGRKFPWGDEHPLGVKLANVADESARKHFPEWTSTRGYDDGFVGTAPVGSFPAGATPVGAFDMIGNVWEWTADGKDAGRYVRGASWTFDPAFARISLRGWSDPKVRAADGGLRCVK
jgi:formylglycine-generating enzyme required for sulfatase activity